MTTPESPQPKDQNLLLEAEVVARYRDQISAGTLRNWRSQRIGPPYIKIGKAVLYSEADLTAWDKAHTFLGPKSTSVLHNR